MKLMRDAVQGDITLSSSQLALIDTPFFQRMRGIKQLGTTYLVFPSALHTRFEHSLGTAWLAQRMLDVLAAAGFSINEKDHTTATLAALLHDITHVPFGHTFEDERRLFERHDEDAGRLDFFLSEPQLKGALDKSGVAEPVRDLLGGGSQTPRWIRQLVAGTVCADLLDYLRRDAYFCGLRLSYDDRLLQCFALVDDQLVVRLHKGGSFRRDALSELIQLLQIRYSLTERVYYHHAKVVSGAMVSRALELAMRGGQIKREDLFTLRDDSLLERLAQMAPKVDGLGDLMEDWNSRRLYKRCYLLTMSGLGRPGLEQSQRDALAAKYHSNPALRCQVEAEIAQKLGVPESHVIVYCPSPKMSLKEADVPVEVAAGAVHRLSELNHPDVEALKEKHRGLWRFYVWIRRSDSDKLSQASALCEELFAFRNQLGATTAPAVGPTTSA